MARALEERAPSPHAKRARVDEDAPAPPPEPAPADDARADAPPSNEEDEDEREDNSAGDATTTVTPGNYAKEEDEDGMMSASTDDDDDSHDDDDDDEARAPPVPPSEIHPPAGAQTDARAPDAGGAASAKPRRGRPPIVTQMNAASTLSRLSAQQLGLAAEARLGPNYQEDSALMGVGKSGQPIRTSKYRGVRYRKNTGPRPWQAHHRNKHIGCYATEVEAAHAYMRSAGITEPIMRGYRKRDRKGSVSKKTRREALTLAAERDAADALGGGFQQVHGIRGADGVDPNGERAARIAAIQSIAAGAGGDTAVMRAMNRAREVAAVNSGYANAVAGPPGHWSGGGGNASQAALAAHRLQIARQMLGGGEVSALQRAQVAALLAAAPNNAAASGVHQLAGGGGAAAAGAGTGFDANAIQALLESAARAPAGVSGVGAGGMDAMLAQRAYQDHLDAKIRALEIQAELEKTRAMRSELAYRLSLMQDQAQGPASFAGGGGLQ